MSVGAEKTYFDFLHAGDWRIQQCQSCDQSIFYPRQFCPHCGGADMSWVTPSGLGTVYSISRVHNPADPAKSHDVLLVDLDEGVRMMSCAAESVSQPLAIGSRVCAQLHLFNGANRVVFQAVSNDE